MNRVWIKFYRDGILHETLNFADIHNRVSAITSKLKVLGIKKQDRVIVMMNNSITAVLYYLALKDLKAIVVPLSPKESKVKLDYIINNCKPRLLINDVGDIKVLSTDNKLYIPNEQIQTIIYTSGTTGTPKGVCLSWKEWEANAKSLIIHHKLSQETILATPLPLFHCNAHGLGMFTTYIAKSRLILFDKLPSNFLEILNKEKVNIASVVPSILYKLVKDGPDHKFDDSFKYFLTAAAPLNAHLLEELLHKWRVKIIQGFGLSESVNFSCTLPNDIDIHSDLYKKIMFPYPSIGISIPMVKIELKDVNNENETGEVLIESPSNCLGYWGGILEKQLQVNSGDLGYFKIINARKYFYLRGRTKELINRGGEKIFPLELESEIRSLGIENEFHVIGIPDEKYGEEIAITVKEKFDFNVLLQIPLYRRPKTVYLLKEFLITSTGKVKRIEMGNYCSNQKDNVEIIWRNL